MTPLWVLRHAGAVVACAPAGHWFTCMTQGVQLFGVPDRDWNAIEDMIADDPSATRYEHNGYTLALEPHPTPGVGDG